MKILIDEQLPTKLKFRFIDAGYTASTVRDMNWLGKKNGDLLASMQKEQFDILITNDKNLYYQQRITSIKITIININTKTNRYDDVLVKFDSIKNTLKEVRGKYSGNYSSGYYTVD